MTTDLVAAALLGGIGVGWLIGHYVTGRVHADACAQCMSNHPAGKGRR